MTSEWMPRLRCPERAQATPAAEVAVLPERGSQAGGYRADPELEGVPVVDQLGRVLANLGEDGILLRGRHLGQRGSRLDRVVDFRYMDMAQAARPGDFRIELGDDELGLLHRRRGPLDVGPERAVAEFIRRGDHDQDGIDADGAVAVELRDVRVVGGRVIRESLVDQFLQRRIEIEGVDLEVRKVALVEPRGGGKGQALDQLEIADGLDVREQVLHQPHRAAGPGSEMQPHARAKTFAPVGCGNGGR